MERVRNDPLRLFSEICVSGLLVDLASSFPHPRRFKQRRPQKRGVRSVAACRLVHDTPAMDSSILGCTGPASIDPDQPTLTRQRYCFRDLEKALIMTKPITDKAEVAV